MPTRPLPRCSHPRCPHLKPCPVHTIQRKPDVRDRSDRGSSTQRGYDASYRAERIVLLADEPMCHWQGPRCKGKATTADHVPQLRLFASVREWREAGGFLVPSCGPCNFGSIGQD